MSLKRTRPADPHVSSRLAKFACKRCRSRKVKCDEDFPRCAGCSKAGAPCIVTDYSTTQDFTRAEVYSLEQELADLEARLASATNPADDATTHVFNGQPQRSPGALRFVGPGSSVQQPIVDAMRRQHPSPQGQEPLIEFHAPHRLPDRDITQQAIIEYFREFHVAHPVLDQAHITAIVEKIYSSSDDYRAPAITLSKAQKHDLFQLNMMLAIGGIRLYRDGCMTHHPFGFFTAALEANPPSEYSFCTVEDVEYLLLIALFGLFYNIGCSIWELGRLCVRICIELKLHESRFDTLTVEMQRGRRMFWESYLLDRFASSTLGRPYAIDDAVIDIDAPQELASDTFSQLVRMSQITSDMHTSIFYPTSNHVGSSEVAKRVDSRNLFSTLRKFHAQLTSWRRRVPIFEHQTCVYETSDFFELTFQESRLWLFRAAINNLPTELSSVREKLLLLCLQAAQQVITCFDRLGLDNLATRTRSSTRLILISGLTTVSVLRMQTLRPPTPRTVHSTSDVDIDFWLDDLDLDTLAQSPATLTCRETIGVARRILSGLATQMPDVVAYAQFFEILQTEVERIDQCPSSGVSRAGVREGGNNTDTIGAVFNPTESVATEPHQSEQFHSHGIAHLGGDLDPFSLGIHEQETAGTTSLDDLLSGILQGDHFVSNNDGDLPVTDSFWSISNASWMDEIDGDISGFIWDTAIPWQGSPFANP